MNYLDARQDIRDVIEASFAARFFEDAMGELKAISKSVPQRLSQVTS
jgi:hypothetical protein